MRVCVFVRERESVCVFVRERERVRERECVCVFETERGDILPNPSVPLTSVRMTHHRLPWLQ